MISESSRQITSRCGEVGYVVVSFMRKVGLGGVIDRLWWCGMIGWVYS